ncbi:clostripain-related cysteine peptidase [Bacillus haynesii]|uniref:Clostripain-related cysteine peptidase n=1 Tax=Bacillus haynesii TaxID=1925021 RepID=A0AA90ERZ7_9BACI|nr:clostripain-related cysteine peptidase [Bacillus haynesii]MCY7789588.1 clostripain-related cysteine peptidase [Bacillus haynesii]MCY8073719.1 clostripain-related cysteine peptidase [Bacillus haynesii]MCY8587236.1 clostripain-related cysteine peptidase [Bacillus haynesii]MCY9223749.1 clostripain-related cysteine peptidase [Bacillus haynesii]MCY9280421.1 clostripain-related cysteine peptidase [Bacillus haynesii]
MNLIKWIVFSVISVAFFQPASAALLKEKDDYTILVYMIGSDMESDFHMASDDIQEMMDAGSSSNVNVVLQTGGAKKWANPSISHKVNQRWKVEHQKLVSLENIGKKNMDSPGSVTDFITWGVKKYPAKKYVLIFWGHGLGSVDGYGGDENFGNKKMKISELQSGIKKAYEHTKQKFDLIGFDNCKMAGIETAYALKDYGRYMLASVDYTNQNGWDYKRALQSVQDDPSIDPKELGREIAAGYIQQSKENGETEDLQQSLIQLNRVKDAVDDLDRLSLSMNRALKEPDGKRLLHYARLAAEDYADESDMVDLADLSSLIGQQIGAEKEAKAVVKSVKKAVIMNIKSPEHPRGSGMSVYYPARDNQKRFAEKSKIYHLLDFSARYQTFIKDYSHSTFNFDL